MPTKIPIYFFILVALLSVPFWVFGEAPMPLPVRLPYSALTLITPLLAALILTYRSEGTSGIKALFQRVLDYPKIDQKRWYLPILLINPAIMLAAYIVMRLTGQPLPEPQIPWLLAPLILVGFFIAGIGEELGWMGYAFDPMERRWGALKAALVLGLIWAVFHLIADVQNQQPAGWIFWHRLGSIAVRVLIVWIYMNTNRSIFAVILYHAMNNVSWAMFPNYGSHYNPFITTLITLVVVGLVLLRWRPERKKLNTK